MPLMGCRLLCAQLKVPDAISDADAAQFLSAAPHAHAIVLHPCGALDVCMDLCKEHASFC